MRFEPTRAVPVTAILLGIGAIGLAIVGVFMESDTKAPHPVPVAASSDLVEVDTELIELAPSSASPPAPPPTASSSPKSH